MTAYRLRRFQIISNYDFEVLASFDSMENAEKVFGNYYSLAGEHLMDSETGKILIGSLPFLD